MRQLPVGATVQHAINSAVRNFPFAVQISLPWMLVLIPLVVGTQLYVLLNGLAPAGGQPPNSQYFLVTLPMLIVQAVAFASVAVNWHRYILLDEIPQGWERLRVDSVTWRYLGNFILIMLVVMLCMVGLMIPIVLVAYLLASGFGKAALLILVPAYLFAFGWGIMFGQRLSIKLPAVALGRTDFGMRDALNATVQNGWRIFGVMVLLFLCAIVIGVINLLVTFIFSKLGVVGLSLSMGVQLVVQWISTILGITTLTSLYGYFVEGRNF